MHVTRDAQPDERKSAAVRGTRWVRGDFCNVPSADADVDITFRWTSL
jgi:hypothetical protein